MQIITCKGILDGQEIEFAASAYSTDDALRLAGKCGIEDAVYTGAELPSSEEVAAAPRQIFIIDRQTNTIHPLPRPAITVEEARKRDALVVKRSRE